MRRPLSDDTTLEVEEQWLALLRAMTPARKMELVAEAIRFENSLALAGLRHHHPEWTPSRCLRERRSQLLGEEVARRIYGPPEG